jgi:hypothetical protein
MPNIYEEIENGKKWKKNNGTVVNTRPGSGFLKWTNNSGTPYYENLASGETTWELPRNRSNSNASAATIASLESNLSSLRSECGAKDVKIAALEAKLAACGPSIAPAAAAANNSGPAVKFKKMLKMGIPRVAVEQKMRMEGLEPSLLNAPGAAVAVAEPAATPFRPPMGGPMAGLLAGIGTAKLKKTEGPVNKGPSAEEKPKNSKQSAAAGIAAAAAARRAAMKTNVGNIEARLAAKRAAAAAPSESMFKKELRSAVAAKSGEVVAPVVTRQILTVNEQGALPEGWRYFVEGEDKWYAKKNGSSSQWERPTAGGKRKTRKSRRSNRKTRRN